MIMCAIGLKGTTAHTPAVMISVPAIISGMAILCRRPLKSNQRPRISVKAMAINVSMMWRWPMIANCSGVLTGKRMISSARNVSKP